MKTKNLSIITYLMVLSTVCFLLSSCDQLFGTDDNDKSDKKKSAVTKITFSSSETTKTMTIPNLSGKSVFLVKTNTSPYSAAAKDTGSVKDASSSSVNRSASGDRPLLSQRNTSKSSVTGRVDYGRATEFNANPPRISRTTARGALSSSSASLLSGVSSVSYTLGETKKFSVQDEFDAWVEIDATVQANGTYCYVWVAEDSFSESSTAVDDEITRKQAQSLADTFDRVYPVETALIGYEYGGDPSDTDSPGGVDGDTKISILVYDIYYDYDPDATGGVYGYFWGKDEYSQTALEELGYSEKSNNAEMFYLDSAFTDSDPDQMYSTLIHEFQHMVNFNEKYVKQNIESDTWFNEMLSLLCEDVIDPIIGIASTAYPSASRLPLFNAYYDIVGVTEWYEYEVNQSRNLISYSNAYAFGAYLVRNYGGADLLRLMAQNNSTGTRSVSSALNALYPKSFDSTDGFTEVFNRYGEALVFSGSSVSEDVNTFDRSVSTTIGGTIYTFLAIDIWTIGNYFAGYYGMSADYKGPTVYSIEEKYSLYPYTHTLQSADEWQNVSGTLTIEVTKPVDPDVELYLMVR